MLLSISKLPVPMLLNVSQTYQTFPVTNYLIIAETRIPGQSFLLSSRISCTGLCAE